MASTNIDDQGPLNAFFAFFEWCQQHLRQRGWDRLDEAAARYLRNWSFIQRDHTSNTGDAIMRLLDAVPQVHITKARLSEAAAQGDDTGEQKWMLPSGVDLRGLPTCQMRTIPDDQRGNGRVVFLDIMEAHMGARR
ncbi:hypothetical protein PI125_g19235 [Phytophthora idaei]|nr:hypothetical protein PI125_g19235 [Phytophthora idaei]